MIGVEPGVEEPVRIDLVAGSDSPTKRTPASHSGASSFDDLPGSRNSGMQGSAPGSSLAS
jgi:hypothetical protein